MTLSLIARVVSDMDECELEDIGQTCAGTCINTIGSFRCSEEDAVSSQEIEVDERADEREAEAIQEAITSTQRSMTTTQTTTQEATTTTATTTTMTTTTTAPTTSTIKSKDKVVAVTRTTSTETPDPLEELEEEEGEEGELEEEELEENQIDNHIDFVETKDNTPPELDQTCPDGFQLADRLAESEDGSACLDVDECDNDNKFGCSHICVNTQGSAHCECPRGWKLDGDRKTCQGNFLALLN